MLKHKSEAVGQFKKFKALVELKKNTQVDIVRHKVYGAPRFRTSLKDQADSKVSKRYN
ncbi:unnamed protein product [Spirodela intermedia]|uniref:Uncharacterized protein n=1 Tax=Spirodela intermedia TaxID=51605 RepID=A0A7I8JJ24_SPIIN|nr:unnamed protein product [Spirodela intermedia]CAA6670167.1 unnamed protein product [Spirodela intermedia]